MTRTSALLADTSAATNTVGKTSRHAGSHKHGSATGKHAGDAVFPDLLASLADVTKDARADTSLRYRDRETKLAPDAAPKDEAEQPSAEELLLSVLADEEHAEPVTETREPDKQPASKDDVLQLANLLLPQRGAAPDDGEDAAAPLQPRAATSEMVGELAKASQSQPAADQPVDAPAPLPADAGLEAVLPERKTTVTVLGQETHFSPTPAVHREQAGKPAAPGTPKSEKVAAGIPALLGGAQSPGRRSAGTEQPQGTKADIDTATDTGTDTGTAPPAAAGAAGVSETASSGDDQPHHSDDRRPATGAVQSTSVPGTEAAASQISSPVKQIAAAVTAELATAPAPRTAAPVVTQVTQTATGSGSVLKVLHIKLEPETLGTVTVRMSLRDNAIEMHIEAANADTADLISADRDALSGLLRSAGYAIDAPIISAARPDSGASASAGQQSGAGQQQADLSAQNQQSSANPGRERSTAREDRGGQPDTQHAKGDSPDEAGTRNRADGSLYI